MSKEGQLKQIQGTWISDNLTLTIEGEQVTIEDGDIQQLHWLESSDCWTITALVVTRYLSVNGYGDLRVWEPVSGPFPEKLAYYKRRSALS